MRVAIMQPYFFPYLGYFSLIKNVDRFLLLDTVQYIRAGWIHRNRILDQSDGWLYIQVPLASHSHRARINEISIDHSKKTWRRRVLDQLGVYKKIAPNYRPIRQLVEDALSLQTSSVVHLNRNTMLAVGAYLGFDWSIEIVSEMDLAYESPGAADEWSLNICKALGGVEEYWNPPGGKTFFDKAKYDAAGIDLRFHEVELSPYDQARPNFEAGLSILDVLMFNSPERVREMLDAYSLS